MVINGALPKNTINPKATEMEIENLNGGVHLGHISGMCHGSEGQPYQKVNRVLLDSVVAYHECVMYMMPVGFSFN